MQKTFKTNKGKDFVVFLPKEKDIYNWQGRPLPPDMRNQVEVGNVVRIQLMPSENEKIIANSWCVTMYFKILEKLEGKWLRGICSDPYNGRNKDFPVQDGYELFFTSDAIREIPTDWEENANFKALHPFSD